VTESETPTNETESSAPESAVAAAVPEAQTPEPTAAEPPPGAFFWGTGRRKCAVARVRLMRGAGKILINQRAVDQFFQEPQERLAVRESLLATKTEGAFDVFVNVRGGGHTGQAQAIRLGVARALVRADARHEAPLRDKGYLTRDARIVERKKYGQRKARRRFQFSKR